MVRQGEKILRLALNHKLELIWSITELAAQGGWKQLQVLKRYTHIKAEYLAKKMI